MEIHVHLIRFHLEPFGHEISCPCDHNLYMQRGDMAGGCGVEIRVVK